MNHDQVLRQQLKKLLDWEDAHVSFDTAVDGVPAKFRGMQPEGLPYSLWKLVEHIRRTQIDILDFCNDPNYEEPQFSTYWPSDPEPPSAKAWEESIAAIRRDRAAMAQMAMDPKIDLFAKVPHGNGQTYLRELLLVADHTAYHVGEIIVVRRLLGIWKS
jgi:DinB superfamily